MTLAEAQKKVDYLWARHLKQDTPESFQEFADAVQTKLKLERRLENARNKLNKELEREHKAC